MDASILNYTVNDNVGEFLSKTKKIYIHLNSLGDLSPNLDSVSVFPDFHHEGVFLGFFYPTISNPKISREYRFSHFRA